MIKFIRKIRQKLLAEGKTGKYLTYAFGEIILVVLGILIALQINNLNEESKDREQEVEYYCLLLQNIEQDKQQIEDLQNLNERRITASIETIREIQKDQPEALVFAQNWFPAFRQSINTFKANDATYEDIKSSGNLNLIEDKKVNNALSVYFKKVGAFSAAIISNTESLKTKLNKLDTWFEAGFYQAYFIEENNNYFLTEDISQKLKEDLPKYISEEYKDQLYDIALFLGTTNQRRSELLDLIEIEVDTIKEILEGKCQAD